MSLASVVVSVIGVSAFVGAGVLGSDRPARGHGLWGRARIRGPRLDARRPSFPSGGRRVSSPSDGRAGPAARWAGPGDLAGLTLPRRRPGPVPTGRLVLGRRGRTLVAAERAQSVIVFGPTQSHKTSGFAIPALLEWSGPVVAASVKTDLIDHTIGHRRTRGEVQCFDPSGSTGMVSATWSPLDAARTWPGARRAAAALTEVARASVGTMTDGDFWYATATRMLAPLLFAAAVGRGDMQDVVRWVDTHEESEVLDLLAVAGVPEAIHAARSAFGKEERQRSSIYTTVETILEPFAGTGVRPRSSPWGVDDQEGGPPTVDPARLVGGDNTLYLCAPAHDQRRLTPLFVSVVRQIVEHVYDRVTLTHRPLDPPLLLVLDEAANIAPLADLDALAATAAGHGVQLVTIWHDLAQITARYGPRATTVVNNHRAKLFLSGISDPSTLDYASHLIGDEEVLLPATTQGGRSGPSTTRSPTTRRLAPPDALRRITPGEGVLLYGDRPPARLRLRPWFDDRLLHASGSVGPDGQPGSGPANDR
jgi:type IV secretion system protein VirD4